MMMESMCAEFGVGEEGFSTLLANVVLLQGVNALDVVS